MNPQPDAELDAAKKVVTEFESVFGKLTRTETDWLIFQIATAIKGDCALARSGTKLKALP